MKTVAQNIPIYGWKIGLFLGLRGTSRGRDPTPAVRLGERTAKQDRNERPVNCPKALVPMVTATGDPNNLKSQ